MPYPFQKQRVRLAVDLGTGAIVDVSSGGPGRFARDFATQFEIGLLYQGNVVDISDFVSATLEILATTDPDSSLAIIKTITPTATNKALTLSNWQTGDPEQCHFRFQLSGAECAEDVFTPTPDDTASHWLTLFGVTSTSSPERTFIGSHLVNSFDAGVKVTSAPPPGHTYLTADEIRALLQDFVTYDVPAGRMLRFMETAGASRTIGILRDAELGLVPVDNISEPQVP